jgi:phosphate transport system substrate-binding protein
MLVASMATGCGNNAVQGEQVSGTLTLSGSTTVLPIAQEAASEFMDKNPDANVTVQGGGSSVGISNVSEGVVDIGDASRELQGDETGKGLVDHQIAFDVITLISNNDVPVDSLTAEQVKAIFTGATSNWKDVGGPDAPIVVVVRDSSSGTREVFDDKALSKQKVTAGAIETNSNGIMRQTVSSTPKSIGYISLGYMDSSIRKINYNGVEGTLETALAGTYPLARYLHMFTKGEPTGIAKSFIDFVLSRDFQNNVVSKEYIPMTQATK